MGPYSKIRCLDKKGLTQLLDQRQSADEEIDLYSIIEFLLLGWKTIVATTVAGAMAGLALAFVLPEKFQASASIEGGKVQRAEIEPIAVTADRMRSPSFYSDATVEACYDGTSPDPALTVSKMINPNIPRNSAFVSITARMKSSDAARNCVTAVLQDVRTSQNDLFQLLVLTAGQQLEQLKIDLGRYEVLKKEEVALYKDQLLTVQQKLSETEQFLQIFRLNKDNLDIKDEKFSASSLLVSMVSAKEREVLDLRARILELESLIRTKSGQPGTENAIRDLKLRIIDLEGQLEPPATREAVFSAPIFAPKDKVEPRRSLIAAGGVITGGLAGLTLLLFWRFLAEYKKRRHPV